MAPKYTGVRYFAEQARKGSKQLTGTVIVLGTQRNGVCRAGIGRPKDRLALPTVTWVSPKYLEKCREVTEEEARKIDSFLFRFVDAFEQGTAEYRLMYQIEAKTSLQKADLQ